MLIKNDEFKNNLKINYKLLYLLANLTPAFQSFDERSKIWKYVNQCKKDMIIAFDLININYTDSGKRIMRSSIESFFRFSLSTLRHHIYINNCKNGDYSANKELKELKSICDSYKIGKLTSKSKEYFQGTVIEVCINQLNEFYTELSGIVHTNNTELFSPQEYLVEYQVLDAESVSKAIRLYKKIVIKFLLVIYWFDLLLERNIYRKTDLQLLEKESDQLDLEILNNIEKVQLSQVKI